MDADTTNARLAELRECVNDTPADWRAARRALLGWMADSPETLPLGLDYVAQLAAMGDLMGRLAQLEEVAALLDAIEDTEEYPALSAALAALRKPGEHSPLVVIPRERLEALERLASAAPAFRDQHARCWSSGGLFKMEIERNFRIAVGALETQDVEEGVNN